MKNVFFGAGKIGAYMLKLWKNRGIVPDYFVDNNVNKNYIEDIPILHLSEIKSLDEVRFFITCSKFEEVKQQLRKINVSEEQIIKGNTLNDMLYYFDDKEFETVSEGLKASMHSNKILLDLPSGFVLGGIEAWAFSMEKYWKNMEYSVNFIINDLQEKQMADDTFIWIELPYRREKSPAKRLELCKKVILENKPCSVICNSPNDTFLGACMAKEDFPEEINVVVVSHNDMEVIYDIFTGWEIYIDSLIVISSKMKKHFLDFGFPKEKIYYLQWEIPCEEKLVHFYSLDNQPIRIGYAGRIEIRQKRLDLLIEVLRKLDENNVEFILEIAGTGSYEKEMKDQLYKYNLQNRVCMLGYVSRADIMDFWKRQDIAISCSEYEGHSISQSEAMAAGAVPVLTDVSGVRDDIQDEYNGFVVDCGNITQLVEKICYLYENREMVQRMGRRSYEKIKNRNKKNDKESLWENILMNKR